MRSLRVLITRGSARRAKPAENTAEAISEVEAIQHESMDWLNEDPKVASGFRQRRWRVGSERRRQKSTWPSVDSGGECCTSRCRAGRCGKPRRVPDPMPGPAPSCGARGVRLGLGGEIGSYGVIVERDSLVGFYSPLPEQEGGRKADSVGVEHEVVAS